MRLARAMIRPRKKANGPLSFTPEVRMTGVSSTVTCSVCFPIQISSSDIILNKLFCKLAAPSSQTQNQASATITMSQIPAGPAKRAEARVRFSDNNNRLTMPINGRGLHDFPPPSPAPAHMRRRKAVYSRPAVHVLKVSVLCLAAVILVMLATWAYHLVFSTPSSSSELWKRDVLKRMLAAMPRTCVSLNPLSSAGIRGAAVGSPDDMAEQMLMVDYVDELGRMSSTSYCSREASWRSDSVEV
jgi:hypothetical protein